MEDFQSTVVKNMREYDITAIDIDYIKDKNGYRIGFGRIKPEFFTGKSVNNSVFELEDYPCDLKVLFEKLSDSDKETVIVGFKNMMNDLYTIVKRRRPDNEFHIGEFYYKGEEDKFLSVLREVSLVNKIMYQLMLFRRKTYTPSKAIRFGKFYVKDFNTVVSMRTKKIVGEQLYNLQRVTLKLFFSMYREAGVKPRFYLILDKSSSIGKIHNQYVVIEKEDELFNYKDNVIADYELNNVLRNSIVNLIVFFSTVEPPENSSGEWKETVKSIKRLSKIKNGILPPELLVSAKSKSVFINQDFWDIEKIAVKLFKLFTLSQHENHYQANLIKNIIKQIDVNTSIRFFEFEFKLKKTGGNEVKVIFTELESIFRQALDKVGNYFGIYKMKYSQTTDYLYNDVILHLLLTYTKILLTEVFNVIAPEKIKKMHENGDSISINEIYKIMISQFFDKESIEKFLKIKPHTLPKIVDGLATAHFSTKTYKFNFHVNSMRKKKILLSKASFLQFKTFEFLKYSKALSGLVFVDSKRTYSYTDDRLSVKLSKINEKITTTVVTKTNYNKFEKEVMSIQQKIQKSLGNNYSVKVFYKIWPVHYKNNRIEFNTPGLITQSTLNILIKLVDQVKIDKVVITIESLEDANLYDALFEKYNGVFNIMLDTLNIIATIPLPYTNLISKMIREFIENTDLFTTVITLIKNKYISKWNNRYVAPEFKFYSYFLMSHMSALMFSVLLKLTLRMKQNLKDTSFMIYAHATALSINGDIIINKPFNSLNDTKVFNSYIKLLRLVTPRIKVYYEETESEMSLTAFSVPVDDLIGENESIDYKELIERINYNVIMRYVLNKGNLKRIVRTSKRIK